MSHFEPGACLSLWRTEECEWSGLDIWRSSDVVERLIYLGLALMLAYTFFALIRFLRRSYLTRLELQDLRADSPEARRINSRLFADLCPGIEMLRGISWAAPFLGLAGTCCGFLSRLWSIEGPRASILAYLLRVIADVPTTTLAGIIVSIPVASSYSLMRTRLEALRGRLLANRKRDLTDLGSFHFAQTLPLRRRFSTLPAFALIGAPSLAFALAAFMLAPTDVAVGLPIALPSTRCQYGPARNVPDRIIVLRIVNGGEVFINMEAEDWKTLRARLSDIYRLRKYRELYLLAEDEVPFQTVADAIDIARRSTAERPSDPKITILLLTPQEVAEREECLVLNLNRLGRHPSK